MTDAEWNQDFARCLGVSLSRQAVDDADERGQRIQGDNFLLLMNAHYEEIPFVVPAPPSNSGWIAMIDSACQTTNRPDGFYATGSTYPLQARSLALLVERTPERVRRVDRRRLPTE
jgi:glycogen operon protein